MNKIAYKLTVANWLVDSANRPTTELLSLETRLAMNSTHDFARIVVYAPPAPQPGLLEQAGGAATDGPGAGGSGGWGPQLAHWDWVAAANKVFRFKCGEIRSSTEMH